jgi:hypothetical protein
MIITTPGASDANSYASIAEADAYNSSRPQGASWAALTQVEKESALKYSALLLDASFVWTGIATGATVPPLGPTDPDPAPDEPNPGQVMCWPRTGMFNRIGMPIDPMVNPDELKYAQAEYARQAAIADLTADNEAVKMGLSSVSAGSVSVSFQDKGSAASVALANPAYAYLSPMVPGAVRLILVPSWYTQQSILDLTAQGGYIFQVDR